MKLVPRFFQAPSKSFFLFGPRGTGKSTLIKERYQDALWIDFLRPDVFRSYLAHPERLYDTVEGHPGSPVVVIDEVQRVPQLLPVVHSLIEEKRGLQFILTGSSARKLKRSGTNLLAGRALKCSLHPFMAAELGSGFSFSRALEYGMLPLSSAKRILGIAFTPMCLCTSKKKFKWKAWFAILRALADF